VSDEQEMQFADPAWQPKVTREFETLAPTDDASSSAHATSAAHQAGEADYDPYARGYRAQSTSSGGSESPSQNQQPPFEKQSPPPFTDQQRAPFQAQQAPPLSQQLQAIYRRLPAWAWWLIGILVLSSLVQSAANQGGAVGAFFSLLLIGALVLAGWLLVTRRVRVNLAGEAQAAETRTFTVGAQPTLVFKHKAGSLHVHAGQEDEVRITTTRRGYLFSQNFDRETPISYSQDSAKNTVTVRTGSWRLFGKNVIHFDVAVPPRTNLQLTTSFGPVSVENIAGQINVRADAGTIQATGVTLQGKSRLKTDAGTITFSGALDPGGNYELNTNFGTIDALLDPSSSFELTAKTDLGTVTTNPPLLQQQRNRANGTVGNGPYPRLKVKTDIGTINVQQK
jgi:hypothetical protein